MLYTRTDGLPQPVATSDLLNLYLLENGNLEVRMPGPDAKKQLAEMRENHRDFDSLWRDLFTQSDFSDGDYWVNYSFALSSIPNICHGSIWDEGKDEPTEFESIWAFYEYETVDEFDLLAEGRSVIFTAVPANKEPNDFCHDDEDGGQFIKQMVDSYLETALWTEEMDDQNVFSFSATAKTKAEKDCREFVQNAYQTGVLVETLDPAKIGRDFWLTRNGHGQGFLNAEYITEAWQRRLDEISEEAGECSVFSIGNELYLESQ